MGDKERGQPMAERIELLEDTHEYLIDGIKVVPSVTTILGYLTDTEYKDIDKGVLEQASRRGTLVHEYTQLMDYNALPDEIEFELKGYLEAYAKFLRDYKPDWQYIELPVYNEKMCYAGTVDRIGKIDGEICVVDIKTLSSPNKMAKFTVACQTSAYEVAFFGEYMVNRYALYLGKDGEYNLVDLNAYEDKYGFDGWATFYNCYTFYKQIETIKNLKPIKKGKRQKL